MTGYPWNQGDLLLAHDLNAAIANSVALGGGMLPLTGGTISPGPLNVGTNSTGGLTTIAINTTNPQNHTGALFLNRNGPTSANDDPQIGSYLNMTHTGGGTNPHIRFQTVVGSNASTWALFNGSTVSSNNTSPEYGHVGTYSQQVRSGVNPGGTQGIGMWSGIFELRSQTGLPSSQDGILQTLELDLLANGADDAGSSRSVLSCVIGQDNTSGAPVEVGFGISFFVQQSNGSTGHYRNMIGAAAPFSQAVLQTNGATQMSGAHAVWLADGHHLAWNNAGSAITYWDTAASAVHQIGVQQFDNMLNTHGGITAQGAANWSSQNYGKQLLITSGGNPCIGITDAGAANFYAMGVNFGQIVFAKMPPLSDSTTTPTYLLGLSTTLNSTTVPFQFGTVGFNGDAPIAKPTVTGSRGGNAALASLISALAAYGLVTDSTSA